MGKDLVCVALAINDKQTWISRNQHQALLYTLPVGTNVHNLSCLLESYGGKTCYIGCNPNSYVCDRCAVICFGDEASKLAAIDTVPVFKGAQVAGGSPFHVTFSDLIGAGLHFGLVYSSMVTDSPTISHLNDWLAILERSLELLTDHVSGILVRLESIDLVPVMTPSLSLLSVVSETLTSNVNSDMIMNTALVSSGTPLSVIYNAVVEFSSSSSKVLTAKVGGLETKLIALEALLKGKVCPWIATRFDDVRVFTLDQDSGNLGSGVAIVVNNSLARHVYKVSEVPGRLLSIKLLFKNKLLVSILGLYAGASLAAHFSQASEVNFLIARAVNEFSFVVLGGDFNEDGFHKCASFKKCLDLGMVNSLAGNSLAKNPTWKNSRGVVRIIDYVFISSNLVNVIVSRDILDVSEYFDTDHQAVCVSVVMFSDKFATSVRFSNLDVMWDVIRKVMVLSADASLDSVKALIVRNLMDSGMDSGHVLSALLSARKSYHASKLVESQNAKEANIRSAIDKRIESFEVNKDHMIRSVLECPFRKVVLDHLVVDSKLVLEPDQIMSKVDMIMEDWTRKHQPLEYVFDEAFSEVMCSIGFDKLFGVVSILPDGKAVGLSDISNELWKHCDRSVLEMLLVLLNAYLAGESVPGLWREAWISMIPKSYEWEDVLTNTHPIVLIETARKILSKVFSDRISAACSTFNVFYEDNFLVLKGMTTQSPIFVIGSVIEDALEKNHKLWLVLQDMKKTYDSVG
ncbi:hypothetical protein G9A89_006447 [Geosiphon pyriformis]|nr:hypothetical protein G9A89_006447 [Geosiphon pyriformis]